MERRAQREGFTLIELSIVLVIIGLIVGGVLVGQDLIRAAGVRATITQIEKYQTAVNTFRGKYNNYLPGDIKDPDASMFGFLPRGTAPGQGNGDGILQGNTNGWGWDPGAGEQALFWEDLSAAHLIEGTFTTATLAAPIADVTGSAIDLYFPQAKLGQGNYIYVWSGAQYDGVGYPSTGINYFGMAGVTDIDSAGGGKLLNTALTLSVAQAYAIDKKMDDGLPVSGKVLAIYLSNDPQYTDGTSIFYPPYLPSQTSSSATSCFDNGNVNGATEKYSLTQNNGAGVNCALSFTFQ